MTLPGNASSCLTILLLLLAAGARSTAQEFPPSVSPDAAPFDAATTSRPSGQMLAAAVEAFRRGDLPRVRDLTTRVITQKRPPADAFKLLAIAEYLLGEPEKFEIHIREALALAPHDGDARYHLARYLSEHRRYREADDEFGRIIALEPDHYKARYYAGLVAEAMAELDRAKARFQAAIHTIERLRVRYAWPYADLGRILVSQGERERGLGWLYRAVRNDPDSPYAHYQYGKALLEQGATPDVERALREALRLDPGYASAYYVLARYYARTGEKQLASEMFATFERLRQDPAPSPYGLRR